MQTIVVTRPEAARAYLSIGHLPPASLLVRPGWARRLGSGLVASAAVTLLLSSIACVSFAMAASF